MFQGRIAEAIASAGVAMPQAWAAGVMSTGCQAPPFAVIRSPCVNGALRRRLSGGSVAGSACRDSLPALGSLQAQQCRAAQRPNAMRKSPVFLTFHPELGKSWRTEETAPCHVAHAKLCESGFLPCRRGVGKRSQADRSEFAFRPAQKWRLAQYNAVRDLIGLALPLHYVRQQCTSISKKSGLFWVGIIRGQLHLLSQGARIFCEGSIIVVCRNITSAPKLRHE